MTSGSRLGALRDYVIVTSEPPGMVNGVALPDGYRWKQASGEVVTSNCAWLAPGTRIRFAPGAGVRFQHDGRWFRRIEVYDVLAEESSSSGDGSGH